MKTTYTLLSLLCFICSTLFLYPQERNRERAPRLTTTTSTVQDQPNISYDKVYTEAEGLIRVSKNNKFGFINAKGTVVIPIVYSWAEDFSNGIAKVKLKNKFGFIDQKNQVVIPIKYDQATSFVNGIGVVALNDGFISYKGLINSSGKLLTPIEYTEIRSLSEGLIAAKKNQFWGYLDATGKEVLPFKYYKAHSFSEGLAAVQNSFSSLMYFIDTKGNTVIGEKFTNAKAFSQGLAPVQIFRDNKYLWGYINKKGEEVIAPQFKTAEPFSEGRAAVGEGSAFKTTWGFIDKKGTLVIPMEFDSFLPPEFKNGRVEVSRNGHNVFIDKDGNIIRE